MFLNLFKKGFLSLVTIALVFAFFSVAKAADASVAGIIISPPITEKKVKLNSVYNGKVKVTNPNTDTGLKITVSVKDFKANGEEGGQTFVDPVPNASYALGSWIEIDSEFTLAANETREVSYSVTVPSSAKPGGHYGVIFFTPAVQSGSTTDGSNVTAIPRIGSLLLFTVPGNIKYQGSLAEFSVNKRLFIDSSNKVDLLTRFQNLSTNHVKPQGDIIIKNMLGKEVATLAVNEKMGNVLPDSIRKFENAWEKKYAFGMYKATANLAFGDSGTATADLTIWIIPWKETAGAIILLIVLIWLLSYLRSGRGKNQPVSSRPVQLTPMQPTGQPTIQQATPTTVNPSIPTPVPPTDLNSPKQ